MKIRLFVYYFCYFSVIDLHKRKRKWSIRLCDAQVMHYWFPYRPSLFMLFVVEYFIQHRPSLWPLREWKLILRNFVACVSVMKGFYLLPSGNTFVCSAWCLISLWVLSLEEIRECTRVLQVYIFYYLTGDTTYKRETWIQCLMFSRKSSKKITYFFYHLQNMVFYVTCLRSAYPNTKRTRKISVIKIFLLEYFITQPKSNSCQYLILSKNIRE